MNIDMGFLATPVIKFSMTKSGGMGPSNMGPSNMKLNNITA